MQTPDNSPQTTRRLQELIVHARDGSPIALAAVVKFVQNELPQASPQLVLSFAERLCELRNGRVRAFRARNAASMPPRLRLWPRDDQDESAAAKGARDGLSPCIPDKRPHGAGIGVAP
jgi:hypothetical protein